MTTKVGLFFFFAQEQVMKTSSEKTRHYDIYMKRLPLNKCTQILHFVQNDTLFYFHESK